MIKKKLSIKKRLSKLRRRYSLIIIALLFIVFMTIPPVIAQVNTSNPVIQAQQNPRDLAEEAKKEYQNGNFQEASQLWDDTVTAFANSGETLNQAMALSNLSLTYQQLGKWKDAQTAIQNSLKLLNAAPANSIILAQTLDIQGNLQRETGKSVEALDTWQKAANIYEELGESTALEQNKLNQVQVMQDLGLYPRACKTLLVLLGTPFEDLTCPPLERQIPVKQEIADKQQEVSGEQQEIKKTLTPQQLEEKLQEIQKNSISLLTVEELRSLGDVLRVLGQQELSQIILTNSLELSELLKKSQNIDEINTEIGAIYLSIGKAAHSLTTKEAEPRRGKRRNNQQKALESYDQAIAISPDLITQQQAKLNKLNLLIQTKQWSEAESLCHDLSTQLAKMPPGRNQVFAQINFAHTFIELLDQNNPQPPEDFQFPGVIELDEILTNTHKNAQNLGDKRAEAYVLGNLGRLYELTGELSTAEQDTQEAISLISTLDSPDIAYQYFWQLGRIQKRQGALEKAISAYTKAYNALEYLRGDITTVNPEVRFSFRDQVEPVYRELVDLNLKYAAILDSKKDSEKSNANLKQAREVIESLQIAQLNNFFNEACIEAKSQLIDQITDKDDSTTAVIYPILLENRFEILLKLPQKAISRYSTPFDDYQKIIEELQNFNIELNDNYNSLNDSLKEKNSHNILYMAQKVYDWIIKPLEIELETSKVTTLVFVLDNPLQNIPMSVLHDGEKYLVEKYAVALTPGLQLLDPKPVTSIELEVLTAGLSKMRQDFLPHKDFPNLDFVPLELNQIKEQDNISVKQLLLDEQFTEQALKQSIINTDSTVIHLATHAEFNTKAEDTFILAWDKRINIKEFDELLRDKTFKRKNAIELLVLSACRTATGNSRAILGLAGVAIQSGARSTLATLWPVVDGGSTGIIMKEFYDQLKNTGETKVSKAEALRRAQLTIIRDQKFKEFSQPHYWASFILIGNWQ